MIKQERHDFIDRLKGLGILFVIIGHAPRDIMRENFYIIDIIYNLIYSFHMGLFFAISGYLFEYKNKELSISKKFKSLIIPFISFSIIIYIIMFFANKIPYIYEMFKGTDKEIIPIFKYIIKCFLGENPYAFHLWFVLVLFITYLVVKILPNKKEIFFIPVFMLIHYALKSVYLVELISINICYFIIGMIFYRFINKIKYDEKILIAIGIVINISIIILTANIKTPLALKLISNCLGSPLIILGLFKMLKKMKIKSDVISFLGKNSFNIYILHQPACGFLGIILSKLIGISFISSVVIIMSCIIFSVVFPIITMILIEKVKLNKFAKKYLNIELIK